MTTPPIEGAVDDDDVDVPGARTPKLGSDVMHRLRLPGPGRDTTRPAPIGSVASSSSRFASGLARSVPSRNQLRGPQNADVQSIRNVNSAPPRWWSPDLVPPSENAPPAPLTPRGLPRAVQTVPSEGNRTPGGILGNLKSTTVPVRRMDAVTAAGPMLTSHDRQKLSAVAVNKSIAQQSAAAAAATPAAPAAAAAPATPAMPVTPAMPPAPTPPAPTPAPPATAEATPPAPQAEAPTPAAPPAAPADTGAQVAPVADTAAPTPPPAPTAAAEPLRPRFLPERRSRLASVRGPVIGAARGTAGALSAGFPRSVGELALAGADPLTSPAADTPAHVRPLPRMVGGGHAVSASANAGGATVAASDPLMFRAGRVAGEQSNAPTIGRRRGALASVATPSAAPAPTAAPTLTSPAATEAPAAPSTPPAAGAAPAAAAAATSATAPTQAPVPETAEPAPATPAPGSDSATGGESVAATTGTAVAPGGGRGRRRATSDAVGIGLTTTRSLRPATRGNGDVRPSLAAATLPTLGTGAMGAAIGATAGAMTAAGGAADPTPRAWLPGAEQRAAGVRTAVPGALSLPGRATSLGMSDLLPSARGLASTGDTATGSPLASAFGAADLITPAGSAATAAPAPPVGAPGADADHEDSTSPLGAARERGRSRRAAGVAAAATTTAAAAGTAATATTAAAGRVGPAGPVGASDVAGTALGPLKRLTETSSGAPPVSHMPAPPPVSIRSSAGGAVPPMSAAASLVRSGDGGLKRSLIDITAGMFDSLPGSTDAGQPTPSGAPPVPAVAQSDFGGSDMSEAERRLSVVRDGDPYVAPPSPLDDPLAMDNLVDEVVQRIEARVIDELERRGRRHNPGVF